MNGAELRAARRELGWTQTDLARESGLTAYKVNQIETGKRYASGEELEQLKAVLLKQLDVTLEETGEHAAIVVEETPDDVVRSPNWNGITRGDEVKVTGIRGKFHFLFHHQDPAQVYVEVYGPIGTKPKQRSFPPERIVKL